MQKWSFCRKFYFKEMYRRMQIKVWLTFVQLALNKKSIPAIKITAWSLSIKYKKNDGNNKAFHKD